MFVQCSSEIMSPQEGAVDSHFFKKVPSFLIGCKDFQSELHLHVSRSHTNLLHGCGYACITHTYDADAVPTGERK